MENHFIDLRLDFGNVMQDFERQIINLPVGNVGHRLARNINR
jgi:hypothetical protein